MMAQTKSTQWVQTIQQSVLRALESSRPALIHLNQDSSWVLSLPYPLTTKPPPGRTLYNVLIDPWFTGPQSDIARWFSTQWHAIQSSVSSVAELNQYLQELEILALEKTASGEAGHETNRPTTDNVIEGESYIDVVICSHEFTDHCHQDTLLQLDPAVPIFAAEKAAKLIRSWDHFEGVFDVAPFKMGFDWRTTSHGPLPTWLGISRLTTDSDALYLHSAVIICFEDSRSPESAEAIIYTPHGVRSESLAAIASSQPRIQTLALVHGLHDVSITWSKQINLGAFNALKLQRLLNFKYWIGTHDEVKIAGGILSPFLWRKAHTIQDALKNEMGKSHGNGDEAPSIVDIPYFELGNGECLVLE